MGRDNVFGAVETFSTIVLRLASLNVLWIVFSLIGLVIGGIAPATAAVYDFIRRWVRDEEIDGRMVNDFWKSYKKMFVRANMLWAILLLTGGILYVDFYFILRLDHDFAPVLIGLAVFMLILYVIVFFYSIPLLVHLKLRVLETVKYALIYGFASPVLTISVIISFFVIHYILYQFPVLYLFFSISIFAYITMTVVQATSTKLTGSQ